MSMIFTVSDIQVEQNNRVWLRLCVEEAQQAINLAMNHKPKPYQAEVKEYRNIRSLDANALYWKLCGMLAKELGETPESIYRRHIQDVGNFRVLCMEDHVVSDFERFWTNKHLGRFIETRASKLPGCTTVLAYYGSSDFNKREMSILIDNCIQDCNAVGVETIPPDKIALAKDEWGNDEQS